jgi:hypothetical protein
MASLGPDIPLRTGTLDAHYACHAANLVPVPDEHDFKGFVIPGDTAIAYFSGRDCIHGAHLGNED